MIDVRISKFQSGEKYSVELNNFEPKGGLDLFIKTYSEYLGEEIVDWNRNWEFGTGRMTFIGDEVILIQSEFPQLFSFDCRNEVMAEELKQSLVRFFKSEFGLRFVQSND